MHQTSPYSRPCAALDPQVSTRTALNDWRTLPATLLELPGLEHGGLSPSEWFSTIQALHARLREAEQQHMDGQQQHFAGARGMG
jgi:hypothetical protein